MKTKAIIFILSICASCSMASLTNEYQTDAVRVIDGDTVALKIHLGFGITMESHCRLYGINAPELHGDSHTKAMESKQFVMSMVLNKKVKLLTLDDKRDKYGRVLGIIMVDGKNVNQMLLDRKLAVPMSPDGSAVKEIPAPDKVKIKNRWWHWWR